MEDKVKEIVSVHVYGKYTLKKEAKLVAMLVFGLIV